VRPPVANTFAQRWIGSIRRERLEQPEGLPRTIIWNRHQLERLATDYNQHRPHRSLDQRPPDAANEPSPAPPATTTVLRTARCDGLVNEYRNAA
ncbi:MAG: transposase, partial [Actinomycetia bacterium]|nr:transposase [Actinomycetes bacterium]